MSEPMEDMAALARVVDLEAEVRRLKELYVCSADPAAARISDLERQLAEAQTRENALRLACNVAAADLTEAGRLCKITDDEYPLKAVERVVSALAAERAARVGVESQLAEAQEDLEASRAAWMTADKQRTEALVERDEAQRVKFGSPCKCQSWVDACGEAESALAAERSAREKAESDLRAAEHAFISRETERDRLLRIRRAALESIAANKCCSSCQEAALVARAALAAAQADASPEQTK